MLRQPYMMNVKKIIAELTPLNRKIVTKYNIMDWGVGPQMYVPFEGADFAIFLDSIKSVRFEEINELMLFLAYQKRIFYCVFIGLIVVIFIYAFFAKDFQDLRRATEFFLR
jgi:hypothetical protein